jgi:shikimate 5-dehydrogenase
LKRKAAEASQQKSPELVQLHSANTLTRLTGEEFRGHNTDLHGFAEMIDGIENLGVAVVWGGGGTLPVIQKVLPQAQAYSIRTRQPRDPGMDPIQNPQTLIWAGSPEAEPPGPLWKPRWILDLNYREDSRAQEYAQKTQARYVSGLLMFKAQAQAQREEWESHGQ